MSRPSTPDIPAPPSSWMDLLAQATLSDTSAETLQAEIVGDVPDRGPLRLVVQSFEAGRARPVGSVQRAVTAGELRDGVVVRLVELRARGERRRRPRVVAWVESGPHDDTGGLESRPAPGCPYGEARRRPSVRIVLSRRAA